MQSTAPGSATTKAEVPVSHIEAEDLGSVDPIPAAKSICRPSRTIEFLGVVIHLQNLFIADSNTSNSSPTRMDPLVL